MKAESIFLLSQLRGIQKALRVRVEELEKALRFAALHMPRRGSPYADNQAARDPSGEFDQWWADNGAEARVLDVKVEEQR